MQVIRQLPPGLCGVVLRHDTYPNRPALAKAVARLCRQRHLALNIAGDPALAKSLHAGLHVRGGTARLPNGWRGATLSAAVHNPTELRQAQQVRASLVFISPIFATASHPGAACLGVHGWWRLARHAGRIKPYALGGINGGNVRRLGPLCRGVGGIEAFF